jgi:hypothetical protein
MCLNKMINPINERMTTGTDNRRKYTPKGELFGGRRIRTERKT